MSCTRTTYQVLQHSAVLADVRLQYRPLIVKYTSDIFVLRLIFVFIFILF
jgi:hypothetical protein